MKENVAIFGNQRFIFYSYFVKGITSTRKICLKNLSGRRIRLKETLRIILLS